MHRSARGVAVAFVAMLAATSLSAGRAEAAAPWIYRGLTLPRHDVALGFGLGYGHSPPAPGYDNAGWGLNLELRGAVTHNFELGLRMGFRLDDGGQNTQADRYGRPFDTEQGSVTYGMLFDRVSNPELRFRWSVARGYAAELGLELRAYLPIETASRFGFMFGLPIALRAGPLRFDTGLYVPVIFYEPQTYTAVSVPLHIWIQAAYNLWLGPILGFRVENPGSHTAYPLGFGLGIQTSRAVDLRTWFLFPDMNRDAAARSWGVGIALEVRFE
jgi:hypothetical protein